MKNVLIHIFNTYRKVQQMKSKKLLCRSAMAVLFITAFCSLNTFAGINDGLIAYYPFDEDAKDLSGNGNDGIAYSGVTYVKGVNGAAVKFDGISGKIEVPDAPSLHVGGPFSTSIWLQTSKTACGVLLCKLDENRNGFIVYCGSCCNNTSIKGINFQLDYDFPSIDGLATSYPIPVEDGGWHHFIGSYDGAIMKVYLDGILVDSSSYTAGMLPHTNHLLIGSDWTSCGNENWHFQGCLDEVRLYNRALNENEVMSLFQDGFVESNGVFQNGDFETGDLTGWNYFGNSGVATGTFPWGIPSEGNCFFDFNGGNTTPDGIIQQTIKVTPGSKYLLSFDFAKGGNGSGTAALKVEAIGKNVLATENFSNSVGGLPGKYTRYTLTFIPDDTIAIIRFTDASIGTNNFDVLIDDIVLHQYSGVINVEQDNFLFVSQNIATPLKLNVYNGDSISHVYSIELSNDNHGIIFNNNQPAMLTLSANKFNTISLLVDASSVPPGTYNDILLKFTSDDNQTINYPISIEVLPPNTPSLPDLSITATDINLTDYTINGPATLDISVCNNGTAEATNVPVTIYRFNNFVTTATISSIALGATQTIQVTIPVVTAGEHLINVFVDSLQTIGELDKTNNEANKIIKIGGQPVQAGGILVTAALPKNVYTDALFNISGCTMYDVIVDGVRYLNFPVKGGAITLTISDNDEQTWVYNGGHSTISGDFSKVVQAPSVAGDYTATITATDQTFSGSRTVSFFVIERPAQPPQPPQPPLPTHVWGSGIWTWYPGTATWEWTWDVPPSTPVPQQDISVYSENIHFSNSNPAQGEETTIFTEFNYWSTSTALDALNVPVNIYVTRPGSEKVKIGSAVIDKMSVSAPENGSRFVYVNWKNDQDGVYIVEAEVDPSYIESNMKNNAATRAIIVGEYAANQGILSGQVTGPEGGMKGVGIELYDDYGMLRYTTTTDNGFYLIDALQVGTYTVKCVVPDGYASDTVSRTVEIVDQQVTTADFTLYVPEVPPVPDIDPLTVLSGECSVDVTAVPTAKDHSGNTINGTTDDPVSYTEQGEYTINWHFTDAHGTTTTQTQSVIVKDNTPPEVEALSVLTGECSVVITTPPTAEDNCAGIITGTTTSSLPLVFDQQGTFSVIWTFSDGHGNSAMQTQTVVVADNLAPVPDLSDLPDISGTGSVNVMVIPTATDNCIGTVNGTTSDPLTYNQSGTYTITWNYSDEHGNNSSQQQKVIVSPDAPVERCISDLAARAKLDKIQLTWTDNGSSVYHVFRSEEGATSGFSEIVTTSSTYSTYLDEGLTVGKTYWYKVAGDGSCSNSEVVSAVPQNRTTRTR